MVVISFQSAAALFAVVTFVSAQRADGQYYPCNPLVNATGACTPNLGLPTSTYSIDFTKRTALPANWTIANYETVNYGSNGAEFTFAKRYDSPQIWTDFYMLFGTVETVMQIAPGQGIISSSVLISDALDEIDLEFSGNDFGTAGSTGMGQNNYFGKGITGNYDRGEFFNVASPQTQFHTYTVNWTPTQLTWAVDGTVVRTLLAADCDNGTHQYPQTPSKVQLGMWDGGDAGENWGTVSWAGGYTNLSLAPFTMYVKSIKIVNDNPAYAYNYTDQSGRWQSIQMIKEPVASIETTPTSAISTVAPSASSSVAKQASSALSSQGAQFAGTASTPSVTASIAGQLSTTSTTLSSTKASTTTSSSTTARSTTAAMAPSIATSNTAAKSTSSTTTSSMPAPTTTSSKTTSSSISNKASSSTSSTTLSKFTSTSTTCTKTSSTSTTTTSKMTTSTTSSKATSTTKPLLFWPPRCVPGRDRYCEDQRFRWW